MYNSVKEYLDIGVLQAYVNYYRDTDRVTKTYIGPYSAGWLDTIQRTISAFAGPFLEAVMSEDDFKARFSNGSCRAPWCERRSGYALWRTAALSCSARLAWQS